MSKKLCVVAYTAIDDKVRKHTIQMPNSWFNPETETMMNNISKYIETKQWPEKQYEECVCCAKWGLSICPTIGTRCHSKWREFPTQTQFMFYRLIVHMGIVCDLALECSRDEKFRKALLKEAEVRARKKDEAEHHYNLYQDALTRAKNRIRYHRNNRTGDEYFDFCRVIEEFELFDIRKIQLCTGTKY